MAAVHGWQPPTADDLKSKIEYFRANVAERRTKQNQLREIVTEHGVAVRVDEILRRVEELAGSKPSIA